MKSKKALLCSFLALFILFAVSGCDGSAGANAIEETENLYDVYNGTSNENSGQEAASEPALPDGEFSFSAGLDENGFWQGIRVLDYVEIFNYQAMEIPAEIHQIPEQDIQEVVDSMLFEHITREQITDRAVAYGDTVNIDFVGSVDGVEFDGGSTFEMGTYVTIGVTQFIDDFLDQLIGHMPGTVVNVEVTFPDEYHAQELQGAEALFVTTINYINGEEIRPELTDAFVMENFTHFHDVTTVDELFNDVRSRLQMNAIQHYIHEYVSTQVVVRSIPEQLLRYYEQALLQQYKEQAVQFGMDIDDVLGMFGFESVEDFIESSREEIESEARFSLIFQAVAEDAGIVASVQDVTAFFEEHFGSGDFSMFEEMYGLPWLKQFIRDQMVMEYISERVVLL